MRISAMTDEIAGIKVKIPKGYTPDENGVYVNHHGVEYGLVVYGHGQDAVVYLETVYSKNNRMIKLEKI